MVNLENYSTLNFEVKCRTGVVASSVDGMIILKDSMGNTLKLDDELTRKYYKKKLHAVNKKTVDFYYTKIFTASKNKIEMHILEADWLCRKGLNWHVIYHAEISFVNYKFHEDGSKTLEYWLGRIISKKLIPKDGFEEPKGEELGKVLGVSNFTHFYGENVKIEDIFKAYEAGQFYGRTGFYKADLHDLPFGVEIEFTGMTRKAAAEYLAEYFGTVVERPSSTCYDRYKVKDTKGRFWSVKKDASINNPVDYYNKPTGEENKCELETPILEYEDIEMLQEVLRGLRKYRYMRVNKSCGIHVHVGGEFTAVAMKNIYNLISSHQRLLYKALEIRENRMINFCRYVSGKAYIGVKNTEVNMDSIRSNWERYEGSRYRMVNFHSFFSGKGVEFRLFNSTSHAGKLKAYIQLSLAICNYARIAGTIRWKEKDSNDLTRMRNWLNTLGLSGDEFKTCRFHMTNKLENKTRSINNTVA